MPIYVLWREADNEEFEADARDDEHAVSVFGEMLGTVPTLEKGPAAPPYMMKRKPKDLHWDKPPDIPVWEAQ